MPATEPRPAQLRRQADILYALADFDEQPSRSILRAERIIGEIEQVATDVRAIARGR